MKGYLITFEGVDYCGKSTQASLLMKYLSNQGHEVFVYREPGGTIIGEEIRNLLFSNIQRTNLTDMFLFSAARAEGTESIIRPAIKKGCIVIADRYFDSTRAYQGIAEGTNLDDLENMIRISTNNLNPDLTFLIDADPKEVFIEGRDKFESLGISYQEKVRAKFLEIAKKEPGRICVIPYRKGSANVMQADIRERVDRLLSKPIRNI